MLVKFIQFDFREEKYFLKEMINSSLFFSLKKKYKTKKKSAHLLSSRSCSTKLPIHIR